MKKKFTTTFEYFLAVMLVIMLAAPCWAQDRPRNKSNSKQTHSRRLTSSPTGQNNNHLEQVNYGLKSKSHILYGFKLGPSLNQFSQPGSFVGGNIGFFAKERINDWMDARVELLYSSQGGGKESYTRVYSEGNAFTSHQVSSITHVNPFVTFNTMEVPVLAELRFPELIYSSIQPMLLVGGSYSMAFNAIEHKTERYNYSDGSATDLGYAREDVSNLYKKDQFSLIAGAGLNFRTPYRVFHIEIRFRQGMTQLAKSSTGAPGTGGALYSSSLIFNTGITF